MKRITSVFLLVLTHALPMLVLGCVGKNQSVSPFFITKDSVLPNAKSMEEVQLKITVAGKSYQTSITDSKTAWEFIAMLPLSLSMEDLNGRGKYSPLPKQLSREGNVQTSFSAGDISYWLGGGLAVFYNADGHEVKAGLIVLAHLDEDLKVFSKPGSIEVTFEAVKK